MTRKTLKARLAGVALVSLGLAVAGASGPSLGDERVPYTIDVQNATAKVGETAIVVATVTPPENFKITKSYRSRVIELSAFEDSGVAFEQRVVVGTLKDGSAVFEVPVTPTAPGEHAINGLIRISFNGSGKAESKSIPLMAKVTGTE